jgi:hypothetical protein
MNVAERLLCAAEGLEALGLVEAAHLLSEAARIIQEQESVIQQHIAKELQWRERMKGQSA